MKDEYENKHSMLQAVNNYLASTAAANLTANTVVVTRRATLGQYLTDIAALSGTRTTLAQESTGATAAKALTRAELNRLIGKIASALVSAFRAASDVANATAVTMTKTKIARTRDQDIPPLGALLTAKAALAGSSLSAHNVSSAEVSLLGSTTAAWGGVASKSTAKRAGASSTLTTAEGTIDKALSFLKEELDPLINTFRLSTTEADRTAAAGYFNARTIIDLHGPGSKKKKTVPPVPQ